MKKITVHVLICFSSCPPLLLVYNEIYNVIFLFGLPTEVDKNL